MTPEKFKAVVWARLDQLDDADLHAVMPGEKEANMFLGLVDRLANFRQAVADSRASWEEFMAFTLKRGRRGKRGAPGRPAAARAREKKWLAARDADRIKALWRELNKEGPPSRPPIHPHDLAAERHGLDRQTVDDAVRRPDERRIDRVAAPN